MIIKIHISDIKFFVYKLTRECYNSYNKLNKKNYRKINKLNFLHKISRTYNGGGDEMNNKKVVLLILISILFAGGIGFYLGKSGDETEGAHTQIFPSKAEIESLRIAVVNLDEGATGSGETINYAEKISKFPSTDFEYTSLEEARTGFASGKYGAYIIIPVSFSQNVESLNSTPQTSQVEYVINKSFSVKSQYELLYNVVSYTETLNDNLSYMYLDNILNEFHNAQDGAANVMNNDLRDKDAIDRVVASDLVALIEIPEIVREENNIEAPDFASYTEKNLELVKSIDEQYSKCVEDIEKEIQKLSESGNTLASVLADIYAKVEEIDLTVDEKGNSIADAMDEKLEDSLNEYINHVPDTGALKMKWEEVQTHLAEIEKGWENANRANNEKAEEQLVGILTSYRNELKKQVPNMTAVEQNDGSYLVTFQQTGTQAPPSITFSIADIPGNQSNLKQDLLKEISGALALAVGNTEKIQIPANVPESVPGAGDGYVINVEEDVSMSVNTVLKSYDGRAQELGYASTATFLSEYSNGNVDVTTSEQKKIQCSSTDWSVFTDYINGCLEQVDFTQYQMDDITDILYDDQGNILVDENRREVRGLDRIEQEKSNIADMIKILGNEKKLDAESIRRLVKDEYIIPITKNADNVKEIFKQRNEDEKNSISAYNENLAAFSPAINSEFITGNIDGITENNTSFQKRLTDNSIASMEYVNKVYQSTEENVENLQKTIMDTKKNSDQAVADGLNEAKNVKAETSRINQDILKEFSEKLPYTRLGSAEYAQAYKFIAKPIVVEDLSGDGTEAKEKEVTSTKTEIKQEESVPWTLVRGMIGILAFFVLFLLIRNIWKGKRER